VKITEVRKVKGDPMEDFREESNLQISKTRPIPRSEI